MDETNKNARIAGWWYLSMGLFAPFALLYVPKVIMVRGNAAATAANVAAHEMLFRAGIVADLAATVIFIITGVALYRLFADVDRSQARLMLSFVLVSCGVGFLNVLNNAAALVLVRGGDVYAALGKPQRDALVMLFLRMHYQGIVMNEMFWGLWLVPFGVLVFRSGFLPKILGILLVINGVAYVVISLTGLLWPAYSAMVERILFLPMAAGELSTMLWLVIMGAKPRAKLTPAVA